jgi:RNA polymerase sigma-70 factor, ECF subfamily
MPSSVTTPPDEAPLLAQAAEGDEDAGRRLLEPHRARLKRMVRLRLSRRLQGRVEEGEVVEEVFREAVSRLEDYSSEPGKSFFLWLRRLTGETLAAVHRRHLGDQLTAADQEVNLHRGGMPEADSISLAAQLFGAVADRSEDVVRVEQRLLVQETLNAMEALDREVLALRHFEQLSTVEIAEVLGMTTGAVGSHYLRAVKRLREVLSRMPGFKGTF